MRYARWTLVMAVLLLATSAVWAGCNSCVPRTVQVQQPCPVPCPQPVAQPCPQPCPPPCPVVCPCPTAVPASVGAGPAALISTLDCPEFDASYASSVFAQNSIIIAVTQYGAQRAQNGNLRDISREIHGYMTSANNKLQGWYGVIACATASPDCARAEAILAQLAAVPDDCFDAVYARTLSELIGQNHAANQLASTRTATVQMRQQAQFLTAKEDDWQMRLDRWVNDHR